MGQLATTADVARLFARAAFGATGVDLDRWTGKPYADLVEDLLAVPDPATRPPQADDPQRIILEQSRYQQQPALPVRPPVPAPLRPQSAEDQIKRWWLERCRTTSYPLEERMVLFWHDHLATALQVPYPDAGMMMTQNQTLRSRAFGNFRDMCAAVTLDPAMLYWLNGNLNSGNKPNENYAREFFELFTLGKYPRIYTDSNQSPNDVHESARALSGWTVDPNTRRPQFSASRHDARTKNVLGDTITDLGDQEYLRIVDISLAQEISPYFLAYKLVSNFAYPVVPANPSQPLDLLSNSDPLVTKVGDALRANGLNIAAGVRAMLLADEFRFAEPSRERQIVRQPIDVVVSACKQLGVSADSQETLDLLNQMGQIPFEPPNVGGWPRGRDWMSPVTMLARYDWGVSLHGLWASANEALRPPLPSSANFDEWAHRFGLASLSDNTKSLIAGYIAQRMALGATESELQQGVMILVVSSPDWMVT